MWSELISEAKPSVTSNNPQILVKKILRERFIKSVSSNICKMEPETLDTLVNIGLVTGGAAVCLAAILGSMAGIIRIAENRYARKKGREEYERGKIESTSYHRRE